MCLICFEQLSLTGLHSHTLARTAHAMMQAANTADCNKVYCVTVLTAKSNGAHLYLWRREAISIENKSDFGKKRKHDVHSSGQYFRFVICQCFIAVSYTTSATQFQVRRAKIAVGLTCHLRRKCLSNRHYTRRASLVAIVCLPTTEVVF